MELEKWDEKRWGKLTEENMRTKTGISGYIYSTMPEHHAVTE
jgi:hypothetical protein